MKGPYACIPSFWKDAKDITVQRTIVLVQRWFAPTAWMETPLGAGVEREQEQVGGTAPALTPQVWAR